MRKRSLLLLSFSVALCGAVAIAWFFHHSGPLPQFAPGLETVSNPMISIQEPVEPILNKEAR